MELRRLYFVSLVAVIMAGLLNLPAGVQTVPLRRDPDSPQLPPYDTHKNRHTRETSESVIAMATTSQLPELEEESTEGSGAEVQGIRCNPEPLKVSSHCKTLQEKLQEYFERNRFQRPLDTFYSDFVLDDLHYFGLLGGVSNNRQDNQRTRNFGDNTCDRILDIHRPRVVPAGRCTWNYTCSYNSNTFPRFKLQASLVNNSTLGTRLHCREERMSAVTYFEQMPCVGDPRRTEHWVERVDNDIVVGYVDDEQASG